MQRAFIISTGTELMLGTTNDTNTTFLSQKLTALGFKVVGKSTVGDSEEYIGDAFRLGLQAADLVVCSGGLGPTRDDLTKETACRVLGVEQVLMEEEAGRLREYFRSRQREMPESNLKQATFPREATVLRNYFGTAPGMYLKRQNTVVVLLPGPPREMQPMFKGEVEPLLKQDFALQADLIARRTVKVLGLGESQVEARIGDLMDHAQAYSLALLACDGEVHIKITAEGENSRDSHDIMEKISVEIQQRMGKHIFGRDEDTLEGQVADLLVRRGLRVAAAESCTGGLLSKMLTNQPGSSNFFWGSVCTYSNQAKESFLHVSPDTLAEFGAVSPQTAEEMAQGLREFSGVDITLSVTGIAGPDGGSDEKPVGLVYLGLSTPESCQTRELRFVGTRDAVRTLAAKCALDLLRRHLLGEG
ncbi:MAG TPA: competence/damage-inducible protein A [Syntrophomonadaceae bacterium]|nr:competence/damage-inducible protein A [Syntrophomonadaceae bacterium]